MPKTSFLKGIPLKKEFIFHNSKKRVVKSNVETYTFDQVMVALKGNKGLKFTRETLKGNQCTLYVSHEDEVRIQSIHYKTKKIMDNQIGARDMVPGWIKVDSSKASRPSWIKT